MNRITWLSEVVKAHLGPVGKAVEVGVWRGDFSVRIIIALGPAQMYMVDPYQYDPDYADSPDATEFGSQQALDQLYQNTHRRIVGGVGVSPIAAVTGYPGAHMVRKTGVDAASDFADADIDFVYIDSEHTYQALSAEIAAWWPKVRSGGILSGHDYTTGNPEKGHVYGVIQAVDEFVSAYQLDLHTTDEDYATWWVVKP